MLQHMNKKQTYVSAVSNLSNFIHLPNYTYYIILTTQGVQKYFEVLQSKLYYKIEIFTLIQHLSVTTTYHVNTYCSF